VLNVGAKVGSGGLLCKPPDRKSFFDEQHNHL
jgi:hypothetical protein